MSEGQAKGTALVTGAGVRVGRAIALALADAGFDLILHAHRSPLDEVAHLVRARGRNATLVTADLSTMPGVSSLASTVGAHLRHATGPFVLINNAADYEHVPFASISEAQFDHMQAVNLKAPFFLTQALLTQLAGGCVINITDMAVDKAYSREHFFSHYLATKAGLAGLTRTWALELGPHIRVNAVAPGPVKLPESATSEDRARLIQAVPLGREGTPEDVAAAVAYLATAPYVTGQILRIDGGLSVA